MARAQQTIGPLHFEDLEPKRFEDLVRQLAYGFRNWRTLEATGRLGNDEGIDIRGVEAIGPLSGSGDVDQVDGDAQPTTLDSSEADEDLIGGLDRIWTIQCKRYKSLTPKQVRTFVKESLPASQPTPYGLILAAACDASTDAMAAFREEAHAAGVVEVHFWVKSRLVGMLFSPTNDHLLFAYFGISLTHVRRTGLQSLRREIAVKRKLMRALKVENIARTLLQDVLIRDIADRAYRATDEIPGFLKMESPPWHTGSVEAFGIDGIWVWRFGYTGWRRADGTWDILESSKSSVGHSSSETWDYWTGYFDGSGEGRDEVPTSESVHIRELFLLPYDQIIEVDSLGDPLHPGPHLYCAFTGAGGPYGDARLYMTGSDYYLKLLDLDQRASLFNQNAEEVINTPEIEQIQT